MIDEANDLGSDKNMLLHCNNKMADWDLLRRQALDGHARGVRYVSPYATARADDVDERFRLFHENRLLKPYRLETLRAIIHLLGELGVQYFLSDGSLLGWFRERGHMIDLDCDTDISIMEEDMGLVWRHRDRLPSFIQVECTKNESGESFCGDGFVSFNPRACEAKKLIVRHTAIPSYVLSRACVCPEATTDVYTYRREDDLYFNNYNLGGMDGSSHGYPYDVLFPLRSSVFEGMEVSVPNKPESWLRLNYGYLGRGAYYDADSGYYRALSDQ